MSKDRVAEAYSDCHTREEIDTQTMEEKMHQLCQKLSAMLHSKDDKINELNRSLFDSQTDHKNDEYINKQRAELLETKEEIIEKLLNKEQQLKHKLFLAEEKLKQQIHKTEMAEGEAYAHMSQHEMAVSGQEELTKMAITMMDGFSALCEDVSKNPQAAKDIVKAKQYRILERLKQQTATYHGLYSMEFCKIFAKECARVKAEKEKYSQIRKNYPCFNLCYKYNK